jgi:hypothetical protein
MVFKLKINETVSKTLYDTNTNENVCISYTVFFKCSLTLKVYSYDLELRKI